MSAVKKIFLVTALSIMALNLLAPAAAEAKGGDEYSKVVYHLKTKYKAKKVRVPFMFLARWAVGVVRPAGIKSFNITLFEKLQFSRATLDEEMNAAMKDSLGPEWSPILRVRSHEGQQVYVNMRESGNNVRLMMVAIDKEGAAIIRATFSPKGLAGFINNPKVFGISLKDGDAKKGEEGKPDADKDNDPEVQKPVRK
jgi:hypothetical protein